MSGKTVCAGMYAMHFEETIDVPRVRNESETVMRVRAGCFKDGMWHTHTHIEMWSPYQECTTVSWCNILPESNDNVPAVTHTKRI